MEILMISGGFGRQKNKPKQSQFYLAPDLCWGLKKQSQFYRSGFGDKNKGISEWSM
jgi:hypothetical protein